MKDEIFEVTRDEFVGFMQQIKKECFVAKTDDDEKEVNYYSTDGARHFAKHTFSDEEGDKYFVYEMPTDEERCAPRVIRKYTLETKEEVEALFEILKKAQGGEKQ